MKLNRVHLQVTPSRQAQPQAVGHLHGGWLTCARITWVVVLGLAVGAYIASVPAVFADAHSMCLSSTCNNNGTLTLNQVQELQHLGLSLDFYATLTIVWSLLLECGYMATGVLIFWRRSDDRMALLSSLALITFGSAFRGFNPETSLPLFFYFLTFFVAFLGNCFIGLFLYLFPSGFFTPRWVRWLALGWIAYWGAKILITRSILTGAGPDFFIFLSLLLSAVGTQIYRYRRLSTPEQRRQTKWVVFGISIALVGVLTIFSLGMSITSLDVIPNLIISSMLYVFLLLIPLSLAIAVLRSHLWDIDIIINRALVYGMLTVCVIALYVLVVLGLGALLQSRGNLLISLLATGLVAVLFQPLRGGLQRAVNRLLYGERDEPYTVISRLGQRLEATLNAETVLPAVVETVAQALKLPYAELTLKQGNEMVTAASYGETASNPIALPLTYQGEQIGELLLALRAPSEPFSFKDRVLLNDLARQAGIAAHAVRLTRDLQILTADLKLSRLRLVAAREEERRRLRRNLHDGLGPTLATIALQAEAARDAIPTEPFQATVLLDDLVKQAQTAISDIRILIYDLRPPALDDLGLIAALQAQAIRYEHRGLRIHLEAQPHLPALPAAVEVAAYRIIQEALTNVVRHAHAHSCLIRLTCDETLHVEIRDDGQGLPADLQPGVGTRSMRERAAELGGELSIETLPSGGTRVCATLPCSTPETFLASQRPHI